MPDTQEALRASLRPPVAAEPEAAAAVPVAKSAFREVPADDLATQPSSS